MGRGGSPGLGPSLGRTSPGSRGGGDRPWREEAGKGRRADLVRDAEDPHGPARAPSASSSRRRRQRLHRVHRAAQAAAAAAAAGRARPRLPGGGRAGARSAPWRRSWARPQGPCSAAPGRGALRPALAAGAAPAPALRALVSGLPRPAALCSSLQCDGPGIPSKDSSVSSGLGAAVPPKLRAKWLSRSHPAHNASAGANSSRQLLYIPKSPTPHRDLGKRAWRSGDYICQ